MAEIVKAVYENGALRLLEPLSLKEHQTVRIQVLPETEAESVGETMQALISQGVVIAPAGHSSVEPISEEERHQLADTLGQAMTKPLSELIIEDRDA